MTMNPTTIFLLGILTGLLMGYLILALIYAMYASYWDYQIHKLELPVEARPSETFWKYITNPGSKGDEGIIFYIIFFGLAGILPDGFFIFYLYQHPCLQSNFADAGDTSQFFLHFGLVLFFISDDFRVINMFKPVGQSAIGFLIDRLVWCQFVDGFLARQE